MWEKIGGQMSQNVQIIQNAEREREREMILTIRAGRRESREGGWGGRGDGGEGTRSLIFYSFHPAAAHVKNTTPWPLFVPIEEVIIELDCSSPELSFSLSLSMLKRRGAKDWCKMSRRQNPACLDYVGWVSKDRHTHTHTECLNLEARS